MHNDYAGPDRQAFLHPPRPSWIDTVVGYVLTAAGSGSAVIVLLGGRYAG